MDRPPGKEFTRLLLLLVALGYLLCTAAEGVPVPTTLQCGQM